MTDNELLEKAALICITNHAGQTDKAGKAYFQHPMRVALRCAGTEQKIVALLHDIIEDTSVTPEYLLEQGFSQTIVDAILSLTKREGESYEDFICRAAENPIGRVVKLQDLKDNLDVMRLNEVTNEDAQRLTKYLAARSYLMNYKGVKPKIEEVAKPTPDEKLAHDNHIQTKSEYYKKLRANINARLNKMLKNPVGQNLMQDKISVRMPNGKIIAEKYTVDSLSEIIRTLGYEKVAALNIMHFNKYPLVTRDPIRNKYREATLGWYILCDCYTKFVAIHVNEIADALDIPMFAEVVPK
jgi:hypothetical protein